MSEPLNDFLEDVERHLADSHDNDAKFGRDVRASWVTMVKAEKAMDEFCKTHHTRPAPVAVKVPRYNG